MMLCVIPLQMRRTGKENVTIVLTSVLLMQATAPNQLYGLPHVQPLHQALQLDRHLLSRRH
jgi:hypothetical protein